MAKPKKSLDDIIKKYGVTSNTTTNKNNSGKQSTSASSKKSTTSTNNTTKANNASTKNNGGKTLDDIINKYMSPSSKTKTTTKKYTDYSTETKNAYNSVKDKFNSKTTIKSDMSDAERKARLKEIDNELNALGTKIHGYSRAKAYGASKAMLEAEKKDKARLAELTEEKKKLERVGTFTATELKQFEVDDAKKNLSSARQKVNSFGIRPSANSAEAYRQAVSEQYKAENELNLREREKAQIQQAERLEKLNKHTTEITSKKDFEQNSKYSPNKPKTDAELKAEGYKKAKDGSWYKENFFGYADYYSGEDSDLYTYINDTSKRKTIGANNITVTAQASTANGGGAPTSGVDMYEKLGYHTLTDEEKGAYNYLYHQDRKNGTKTADEYLNKISPLLQQRAMDIEAGRYKELSKEAPVVMSAISVGTNLQNAAMFPAKIVATATGNYDDAPILDMYGNQTQAIRGGVSEDMPGWGKLLYNAGMSMADMGAAMAAGGGNAKVIQAIMSSAAGSSTISEAKNNGASDGKALVMGLGSAAIEWATEKYSVEAILKDPKTLKGFVLANTFTEATEEGASNVSNIALDTIISEILGERSEIEQRIDYLVLYEGKTEEEAFLIAYKEKLQSLGEDVLVGGLSGFGMSGAKASAVGVSDSIKNNRIINDTYINNNENLEELVEEAKSYGEGSKPFSLATDIEQAMESGNVKRGQIKKLIKANDKAGSSTPSDPLEQAAREVVNREVSLGMLEARRNGIVDADMLEALSQNDVSITSAEVKKVTGLGDRGAEIVAKIANEEGNTFNKAVAEVKASYRTGFDNPEMDIKNVAHTFTTEAQADAYTAGQIDAVKQKTDVSGRAKTLLGDGEKAVGVVNGQAYVSNGKDILPSPTNRSVFLPVNSVEVAKTEFGATESNKTSENISKLLNPEQYTPISNENYVDGTLDGVGEVRVFTDESDREIALEKNVAEYFEGYNLEATFRGGKPYAIKATDNNGNVAGVAMAVWIDTSGQKYELTDVNNGESNVPYNVMSNENPVLQERKVRESYIEGATGYGQYGVQAFANVMEKTSESEAPAVAKAFQTAYEAGLINDAQAEAKLSTPVQHIAFNAGKQDFISEYENKTKNVENVKSHGDKAGFDSKNVPSGVSKQALDIADRLCRELGVKGYMTGKSDKYNANITSNVGVIQVASDFSILENLGEDATSLSFLTYLLHEAADHRASELAPTEYAEFKREMYKYKANKYKKSMPNTSLANAKREAYGNRGVDISLSEAMSEVTANSILELYDNDINQLKKGLDRVLNGTNAKAKKGANVFKQALDYVISKFRKLLGKLGIKTRETYNPSLNEVIKIRDAFENTLSAAIAKNKEIANSGNLVTETDGTVVDANGNVVAQINEDGTATFSLKTFDDSGRAELKKWLDKNVKNKKLTETEATEIADQLEYYYDICKEFEDKYAPFSAWSKAEVVKGLDGKPLMSVVKANGDYKMNLDFSLVCKKRRPLDALYRAMIDDGFMDNIGQLSEIEVARINEIIRKNGFETACTLCFVDSKRYRQYAVADAFVSKYNELVKMLAPEGAKIDRFDFSGKRAESAEGLHTMSDAELKKGINKLNKVIKEHGETTVVGKIAKHLKASPKDRKLVMVSDFIDSEVFVRVKKANPNVFKLYNSSKGSGGPKATLPDVQYLGEILKRSNFTPRKAYAVGGVRVQSFSDYIPRLVFDYLQMTADLSAKKLPAHAYSKEDIFVMQFGKTGIKINMSLVPAVAKDGIAPGLDKNGNYVWVDGHTFASDFHDKGSGQRGFELAVKIQNTEGYSQNCGTIAVGVSDEHIIKMLKDNDIRMVIPYHKSSLNHYVAQMGNIDQYRDYTNVQNTRDRATGKKIEGKDFNFNEAFHRLGDAKAATNEYLAWCEKNNYIPKFDTFAFHEDAEVRENYYKVLIDFAAYDSNGKSIPQGAVTMNFPTENDAFGSMKSLIEKGLEADAILEGRKANDIPKILKEVKETLGTEGKKFSLKEIVDEDGTSYGTGVVLDSTLLDNLTPEERIDMVKEYVKELGGNTFTAFDSSGKATDIRIAKPNERFKNRNGKRVPVNRDLISYLDNNEAKQEAITLIDELIISAKHTNTESARHPHDWLDDNGKNDWDYWTTYIQDKNNTIWEAVLNIANSSNGEKILYDIFPIKKVGQSVTSDTSSTNGSLSQEPKFVKGEFSATTDEGLDSGKQNSLKGTERDFSLDVLSKYAESGAISTEVYNQLIKEFGAIPVGENPSRDIFVPKRTAKNKKVSQTVRTILEAQATPDEAVPTIQKMVEDGVFSYDVYTDKDAIENSEDYIKEHGWTQSLKDWFDAVEGGEVSKDTTTMGWALYNNAANKAQTSTDAETRKDAVETSIMILDAMVRHQRNAAQALQATRILKKLSPTAQLYGVQKSVEAFQKELNNKYGDKAPNLEINRELAEQFLTAETEEARLDAEIEIYKDIGRQMPADWLDVWNAWRYLAMLGNLRTHGRNILGNAFFAPIVGVKNMTATAIESSVAFVARKMGKEMSRSKAMIWGSKTDRALLKAAWNDYKNVADIVSSGGKFKDDANANKYIEGERKILNNWKPKRKFLKPIAAVSNIIATPFEAARKGNSYLLDSEDMWFSLPHYAYALAQYCKANNITPEQISKGIAIAPAREYAIKEASKSTYRDLNEFSQFVSGLGRSGKDNQNKWAKRGRVVVEGVLPFRRTPANILVRGIEYSPIGFVKSMAQIFKIGTKRKDGSVLTATEVIDNISAGLTGTGLCALGIVMAAQCLVRGHGEDDEKEKEFKEMMGHQAYALELPNGQSITLDWLAPEALPFFVGVNAYEIYSRKKPSEALTMSDLITIATRLGEPMLKMSCLQGINDALENIGYAKSQGSTGIMAFLSGAATSYFTQGIPTLLGQTERTFEAEREGQAGRMTTYTEKDDFLTGDMQYTLGKVSAKIPGWDYSQIPYIDAWGRKEASGTALKRGLNNFLNPAYTSEIKDSYMEKELLRLFDQTGEASVFPSRAEKDFKVDGEDKYLTAEEYVRYATLKGQNSYKAITDLVNSTSYKKLTDAEKVKAIEDAYDYANQKAKKTISNYKPDKWVETADEFSNIGNYLSFRTEVSETEKANGKALSREQIGEIALDMAQSDSEIWQMYLSTRNNGGSTGDKYAYEMGIDGETYMYFLEALNDYDGPSKSGEYGTYNQEEARAAVRSLAGLSSQERAILWQSVNPTWKKNPWR